MKNDKKNSQLSEIKSMKLNRRSCAAATNLKAGEKIFENDIIGVETYVRNSNKWKNFY